MCECGVLLLGKQVHISGPYLFLYWSVLLARHYFVIHSRGSLQSQCAEAGSIRDKWTSLFCGDTAHQIYGRKS